MARQGVAVHRPLRSRSEVHRGGKRRIRRWAHALLFVRVVKTLRLLVTDGLETTRLFFTRFPVRIGREAPCECVLAYPFVSKLHALLDVHTDTLVLRDAGSHNGTFVRDGTERVSTEFVELSNAGGEFRIGALRLRAALVGDEARKVDPDAETDPGGDNTQEEGMGTCQDSFDPWVQAARPERVLPAEVAAM